MLLINSHKIKLPVWTTACINYSNCSSLIAAKSCEGQRLGGDAGNLLYCEFYRLCFISCIYPHYVYTCCKFQVNYFF